MMQPEIGQKAGDTKEINRDVQALLEKAELWDEKTKAHEAQNLFEKSIKFYCGRGGEKMDKNASRKLTMQAAALGHQSARAECYYRGWGVEQSYERSFSICIVEATKGNPHAQFKLGVCYERGRGVQKNPERAVKWYHKAAEQGHVSAWGNLGCCYEEGVGVPVNTKKAIQYYQMAASHGDVLAYFNLGACYEGLWDYSEAQKWFRKAALAGYADAQYEMGRLTPPV